MKLINRKAVSDKLAGRSRAAIHSDVQRGLLPPSVHLGERARGWPVEEIEQVVQARVAGQHPDEIRALVRKLIAARQS